MEFIFPKKILFLPTLLLIVYLFSVSSNIADPDLWHRMAVGSIFFREGTLLRHDIFAYTSRDASLVDHSWGSGVILYSLVHYWGDYGLISLKVASLFLIILLIHKINKLIWPKDDSYVIWFYLISIIAIRSGFISSVRAHAFTYLLFTLWVYLLERVRRGEGKLIWAFPVTMALWANLHGGFLAGFGLIAIYAVGELLNRESVRKYLTIFAVTVPATLINPYGFGLWRFMLQAVTMPRPYIIEWRPLRCFGGVGLWAGFRILVVITLFGYGYHIICRIIAKKGGRVDWVGVVGLATTLLLALRHQRHAVFFSILASVFSFHYFREAINVLISKPVKRLNEIFPQRWQNLIGFTKESSIFIVLLALGTFCILGTRPIPIKADEESYPIKYPARAVEFIKINKVKGNLLVRLKWGSYALWKLYPQCLVSMDGRYEIAYPQSVHLDVCRFFFCKKGGDRILKRYHHDIILAGTGAKVCERLKKLSEWRIAYQDETATVYLHASIKGDDWILPDKSADLSKTKYLSHLTDRGG